MRAIEKRRGRPVNPMQALDCSSIETTYASLERILGTARADIDSAIAQVDLEAYCETHPHRQDNGDELLLRLVCEHLGVTPRCDRVVWFHLTRTTPGCRFEDGIQPLGSQLDAIWALLQELSTFQLPAEEWQRFRLAPGPTEDRSAYFYHMKSEGQHHWGPYAALNRDHAFHPRDWGAHDYLGGPEIIQDICRCFQARPPCHPVTVSPCHRVTLSAATRPCIVSLWDDHPRPHAVVAAVVAAAAVNYLYATYTGTAYGHNCLTDLSHSPVLPFTHSPILPFPQSSARPLIHSSTRSSPPGLAAGGRSSPHHPFSRSSAHNVSPRIGGRGADTKAVTGHRHSKASGPCTTDVPAQAGTVPS